MIFDYHGKAFKPQFTGLRWDGVVEVWEIRPTRQANNIIKIQDQTSDKDMIN